MSFNTRYQTLKADRHEQVRAEAAEQRTEATAEQVAASILNRWDNLIHERATHFPR